MQTPQPVVISLYQAHKKLYPKSVHGLFARWRWAAVWFTQLLYYGLVWMPWGDRPAVLFDLGARKFHIFGLVLYPQDFIYLTVLLVISAYALFFFTAIAGRLWCGYACPQTVYTEMFLWIEQKIEGDRSARIRLDQSPWTPHKARAKLGKHALWLALALWTGITFVGYFVPIRDLLLEILTLEIDGWSAFWVLFYSFATWGNAGFMREQVCKYMCPYARFQSVMFDKDTLVVTYDPQRGEPRGARRKSERCAPAPATAATAATGATGATAATAATPAIPATPATAALQPAERRGDCIDCGVCVHVCPTGIDIRKGLQYECIGCAACIDGCNEVMDKVGLPRGLIRYSTENAIEGRVADKDIPVRMFRPRIIVYGVTLVAISAALLVALNLRTPFKADILRDRGSLARELAGGVIENSYRIQLINAAEHPVSYTLRASGLEAIEVFPAEIRVDAASTRLVAIAIHAPGDKVPAGSSKILLEITAADPSGTVFEKTTFYGPRRAP